MTRVCLFVCISFGVQRPFAAASVEIVVVVMLFSIVELTPS
jgi:hypothetical protein